MSSLCAVVWIWFWPPEVQIGVLVSNVAVWRGEGTVLKCQARAKGQRNSQLVDPVEQEGGIVAYSCTRR